MKTYYLPLLIFSLFLCISACKREKQAPSLGTYSGTFTVTYSSNIHTGPVSIQLKSPDEYSSTGNPNYFPAGGSGHYTVKDNQILFEDRNIYTANFDWNLILNGSYHFSRDGKQLKIWANKKNGGHYEYDLQQQ
jgi:hypothetical protein